MTVRNIFDIGKIAALTLIAWSVPPRFWRKAARVTSSIGRDDLSEPAYQRNLAPENSRSEITAIGRRRRVYLRELRFQILGLSGPWRSWRPDIELNGIDHLRKALADGHGAILWKTETVFSTLISKMALHDAGYRIIQLSRPGHGFSTSPFGIRFLNPIWTGVEDRFIAERVLIEGETAADALAVLRARLAANRIVTVAVVPQAHKFTCVPLLRSFLPLPTGPIRLAKSTGAALLPVFTVAKDSGGFEVSIHAPLYPTTGNEDDESIATGYAKQLESYVLDYPDQWSGWQWLKSEPQTALHSQSPTPKAPRYDELSQKIVFPKYGLWTALRRSPILSLLRLPVLFIRHAHALRPLLFPRRGSNLHRLVRARPEIIGIALTRYIAANWGTPDRIARIVDHYNTVEDIDGILNFAPDAMVELITLAQIDPRYRLTLDQPRWLLREGSVIISLWDDVDRIFHLGFCLSTENGKRVAYIGALQGRVETDIHNYTVDVLNSYRHFTKAAWGMRPRDFLVEAFKMFCKTLGVDEIRAVSDINHPQRKLVPGIKLSYDQVWLERAGNRAENGFFILPIAASRRIYADIPAKKRAMYFKRYSMLDAIEADLAAALHASPGRPETRDRMTAN